MEEEEEDAISQLNERLCRIANLFIYLFIYLFIFCLWLFEEVT
jgi:hypothetical protein